MTKSQLVDALVAEHGHPRRVFEIVVNVMFDQMVEAMQRGERVEIRGFGNFTIRDYKSYVGRNPKTGIAVDVSEKRMPFFKAGKALKDALND